MRKKTLGLCLLGLSMGVACSKKDSKEDTTATEKTSAVTGEKNLTEVKGLEDIKLSNALSLTLPSALGGGAASALRLADGKKSMELGEISFRCRAQRSC